MPDGLNPIVKRYLKGAVESQGKELTWEADDVGFLFIVDGKYYEVPYKEFLYDGADQHIQLTHGAVIDRSIVGLYRTIAEYCTHLLMNPETFAYYDDRLVTGPLGRMLSGKVTTDKGQFAWRLTSESVEIDTSPRSYVMYVSRKYYTAEIWELLAQQELPYCLCQMFVILARLYCRCVHFEEPEVELNLEEIKKNIQMRREAEQRQKEMEAMRKAEEARQRASSKVKYGGGVDIELGSGGSLYPDASAMGQNKEMNKAGAGAGVDISLGAGGQVATPIQEQVTQNPAGQVSAPVQEQTAQNPAGQVATPAQEQVTQNPAGQVSAPVQEQTAKNPTGQVAAPAQEQAVQQSEDLQFEQIPLEDISDFDTIPLPVEEVQEALKQSGQEVQDDGQTNEQADSPEQGDNQVEKESKNASDASDESDDSYMDVVMNYLNEMDLPTNNPEKSIRKYYPSWALEPIKDLTGEEFLRAVAKIL